MERQVFYQALYYVGAFYVSWPLFMFAVWSYYLNDDHSHIPTPFWVIGELFVRPPVTRYTHTVLVRNSYSVFFFAVFTLAPLQGLLNAVIFFRPRLIQYFGKKKGVPSASVLRSSRRSYNNQSECGEQRKFRRASTSSIGQTITSMENGVVRIDENINIEAVIRTGRDVLACTEEEEKQDLDYTDDTDNYVDITW